MGMSVIIESINTNRFPGPVDIIYGYIVDNGGDRHQFCLEHDIHVHLCNMVNDHF